jgi:site-specific DNA-methyltransferase (adenine-specific)
MSLSVYNHNPDVLNCLANLSNDEVFTPTSIANLVLDGLPESIWKNDKAKFLDPVCKTGIFLREIASRLNVGLKEIIKDEEERINHILKNQIFGIAITELTSLVARRSLYYSRKANGKYSACKSFNDEDGNIIYKEHNHVWKNKNCIFCRASELVYKRDKNLESHAYQFIHTENPEKIIKNMKFDVIIGNPPYQLKDGEGGQGSSSIPLYHLFVQQAKKLNPRFLSMIIPSRWFSGGKGLDQFRSEMLNDRRIRLIVDYPSANDCFSGPEIKGGVCYFLWNRDEPGLCTVKTMNGNEVISTMQRELLEKNNDTFIRYNEAIPILRKIREANEESFEKYVSFRNPFGIISTFNKFQKKETGDSIKVFSYQKTEFIKKKDIQNNVELVDKYKIFISKAYGSSDKYPHQIINKPFLGEPGTCCTETYILIGAFNNKKISQNVIKYIGTLFFRFLVLQKKITQNTTKSVYSLVPDQDFNEEWTDEKLFKKYKISNEEVEFIKTLIRPMDL